MRAIHRKLLRDLWSMKGQVLAIAAVIGVGVGMYVTYFSTFNSLYGTQQAYYERYRFGDVFAGLKRAPESLRSSIADIPGVAQVETRVVAEVTLDVEGMEEPVTGRLVSVPERRRAILNDLALRQGRYIEPGRDSEVVITEGFALAHGFEPGDTVAAVINGSRRDLEIVGIALSPEFIYTIRPGDLMPDEARFGVLWMGHKALANAFDMEGGFNDVSLRLLPGASEKEVIARLDDLLKKYGGLGAQSSDFQISNWYLSAELEQLKGMGTVVPMIFLGVAAFLLNVVLMRIVAVQREQIAALKALDYSNGEVGLHYMLWSLLVAGSGGVAGVLLGRKLGVGMLGMYNDYFRFPFLDYELAPDVIVTALCISLAAAAVGAVQAVWGAVKLPPAEAMRPEPPARYRRTLIERLGAERWLSQPARMVLRNLERRPMRAAASVIGIGCSGGLLVIGLFFMDAIDVLMDVQFNIAQRQDITLSFVEPRSAAALYEVSRLPGVMDVEPARGVAVRLRAGHKTRYSSITGLRSDPRLQRVVNAEYRPVDLPPEGVLMTRKLGEILGVEEGSVLTVEVLEGSRPTKEAVVAKLVDEFMGTAVYMDMDALHRWMREGRILSGAYIQVDPFYLERLYTDLKNLPAVAGVALKTAAISAFDEQMDEMMGVFIFFNILFASIITIGVVYNAARISLSERSRELASLRVLGFTRGEISSILLGELATVTLLAVPLGLVIGYGFAALMVTSFSTELYRFPLVVSLRTFSVSALVVISAAALSGLAVRRKLDALDLVEVLKTRE